MNLSNLEADSDLAQCMVCKKKTLDKSNSGTANMKMVVLCDGKSKKDPSWRCPHEYVHTHTYTLIGGASIGWMGYLTTYTY